MFMLNAGSCFGVWKFAHATFIFKAIPSFHASLVIYYNFGLKTDCSGLVQCNQKKK